MPGPRHGLEGGAGVWVNDWPRIRSLVRSTWRARSRSKPASMLSAAVSSSETLTALRVWDMVLAAPAIDGRVIRVGLDAARRR